MPVVSISPGRVRWCGRGSADARHGLAGDWQVSFADDLLDEIRNRVGLAEVIGRQVRLIRRGREFVACCPFHQEKTPSFTINEQKGFYHCFGCGAHGTIFDFVMQSEGVGFPEAVERLAQQAGILLPRSEPADGERARRRQSLFDVMDRAASHYQQSLRMPEGKPALAYLRGRGLDDGAIARFRLGFASPGRSSLRAALAREGIAEALLLEAGLLIQPDEGDGGCFDRFRGRVMFPINDRRGRIVGFGGRILGTGEPKYLNSPETPLFHKGRLLYGLPAAAEAARRTGRLIVVEGYMDVIGLALAGYEETVAPLGTALTEEQLQELWRLVPEPILCFDPDAAGRRAAARACERALPLLRPGLGLRFAFPAAETGDDPDQLVRRYPRQFLARTLAEAVTLSQMLVWLETQGRQPTSAEARAAAADRLRARALTIADATVRTQFIATFRDALRPRFVAKTLARRRGGVVPPPPVTLQGEAERPRRSARHDAERTLLAILCRHPALFDRVEDEIGALGFADPEHDLLRQALIHQLSGTQQPPGSGQPADDLGERLLAAGLGDALAAVLDDPLVRAHRLIASQAALDDVCATWRENIDLLRRLNADGPSAPAETAVSDEEVARRLARKRLALRDAAETSE